MRRLKKVKPPSKKLLKRLALETSKIAAAQNQNAEAEKRYSNARRTVWFKPMVDALKRAAGVGQRCMFCSGSEASDVEHFRPKAVFPLLAFAWDNYLWCCTPCNRGKLNRFPPHTGIGGQFVNPLVEDVWDFFFIDEFGFLTPVYDIQLNELNPRAVTTRDFLGLNREAVQETRYARLLDLKRQAEDLLDGVKKKRVSKVKARAQIAVWLKQPFQPDVADYFLGGPGREETPFKDLLGALQ